jgi:hypothetical protein
MPFDYTTIVPLYDSSGDVIPANKGTFTHLTRDIILELRGDVDFLGEMLNITGSNWTNNHFNWTKGSVLALDSEGKLWLSYITDLRTAAEELWTQAGLSGSPSWTISDTNLKHLYLKHFTATVSGSVLTQSGADFSDVTNNSDYVYIIKGTGVTPGRYKITGHTTTTLTLDSAPGDSSAGDVVFEIALTGRLANFTDVRKKSLYQDVRDALMDISEEIFLYVDAVNGNDTTGDGTEGSPYKTWDKVISEANSAGLGVYFKPGAYTVGTTLTANSVELIGESLGDVIIDVSSTTQRVTSGNNVKIRNLFFGDGTTQYVHFENAANLDVKNCVFRGYSNNIMWGAGCADANFTHCSFIGDAGYEYDTAVVWARGTIQPDVTFDSCCFVNTNKGIQTNSDATHDVNEDYCAFYNVTTKHVGGASFNVTNEFSTTQDPLIDNIETCYLRDTSPYIDEASDGYDIGGYSDGPYNFFKTASDSVSVNDSTEMDLLEAASDDTHITEDVKTANMNVSVDMFLSGLFESDSSGDITYLTENDVSAPTYVPDLEYNGAALDVSWDNTGGDLCKLYIAVDDGVTDYSPPSWWIVNASYPAISTTQINGTRGYGIDLTKDCDTNNEWGDAGDFTIVTADGVNDQQWDIALKVRVHNVNKDEWSEVISLSKTYNFNDFDKTMYYCADNPRVVAGEYADHSNYYANAYHTGTSKYTRPDDTDWSDDNRRYAYNPMFKIAKLLPQAAFISQGFTSSSEDVYQIWKDRKAGAGQPMGKNAARANFGVYTPIFINYGNFNYNGGHCFANPSTAQPYDGGTANFTSPVLSSSTSDIRYLQLQGVEGSDCMIHSSHRGYIIRMPAGGNWALNDFIGQPALIDDSDIYYQQADNPWTACLPDNHFYLFTKDNEGNTPGGYSAWFYTLQKFYVNTDSSGNLDYGILSPRKQHSGTDSFNDFW